MIRVLFYGSLLLAAGIAVAVGVAPTLHAWLPHHGAALWLFAQDAVVRRTALACAFGLAVTAVVFFRGTPATSRKNSRTAPPGNIAGA